MYNLECNRMKGDVVNYYSVKMNKFDFLFWDNLLLKKFMNNI